MAVQSARVALLSPLRPEARIETVAAASPPRAPTPKIAVPAARASVRTPPKNPKRSACRSR
ncbi:MAG: hypothetical protein CYG60_05845 [Actinobacteria bacterium]|nr:MAG: hypothetical protein CYG60_05845 [Actinomycetota bacterium]